MKNQMLILWNLTIHMNMCVFTWFRFYNLFIYFFKVQDCHVIKYLPKEEYDGHTAALVVGGKNASPFYVRIPYD